MAKTAARIVGGLGRYLAVHGHRHIAAHGTDFHVVPRIGFVPALHVLGFGLRHPAAPFRFVQPARVARGVNFRLQARHAHGTAHLFDAEIQTAVALQCFVVHTEHKIVINLVRHQ